MENRKEYYFSISIIFNSIFITSVFVIMIPLIVILYIKGGFWVLPILIVYLFMFYNSIPTYKSLFFKLKNIPAIILTENEFIDNLNKQRFNWDDIKRVSYDKSYSRFKMTNIYFELYDPNAYNVLSGNKLDRLLRKLDNHFYKGSYRFSPNIIKGDNKALLKEILLFKDNKSNFSKHIK
ncbi:MAG: hypothetical protein WCH34_17535 [Bacteroidota bacterium]